MLEIEPEAMSISPLSMEEEPKELTTKELYFQSLAKWAEESEATRILQDNLQQYHLSMMYIQFNRQLAQAQDAHRVHIDNYIRSQQRAAAQRVQPIQLSVARLWKRLMADLIDKFIIGMAQLLVTYLILALFRIDGERGTLREAFDEDYLILRFCDILLDLYCPVFKRPGHMMLIILMLTSYECLWVYEQFSTPGKAVMNVRVIYARAIVRPNQMQRRRGTIWVNLFAVTTPSLVRCFKRAFFKHVIFATPYGIYELFVFALKRRATYEVVTRTLVVQIPENRY